MDADMQPTTEGGMTDSDAEEPDFNKQVVGILVKRAEEFLSREKQPGGYSRVELRAWMMEPEFHARLQMLREHGDKLHDRWDATVQYLAAELTGGDHPELGRAIEVLSHRAERLLRLKRRLDWVAPSTNIEKADEVKVGRRMAELQRQLADLHELFEVAIDRSAEAALTSSALPDESVWDGEGAHLLFPEELEQILEPGSGPAKGLAMSLAALRDSLLVAQAEAFNILVGRFRVLRSPGRRNAYRGQRLSAELLGVAEGLGLYATRGRERGRGGDADRLCGGEVVVKAINKLRKDEAGHPSIQAILDEAPASRDALEDLAAASNPSANADGVNAERNSRLAASREFGRRYGKRELAKL
jgi:hypothetical protein